MNKIIIGLLSILFICQACDKSSSIPERFTAIPGSNSNIKFLMLSPNAPQVNFFINGNKSSGVAPTTTNVVQGLTFPGVFPGTIGYTTVPSGSVKIDAKVTDSSTVTPGAIISTSTQNIDARKFYTYAIVDSVNNISSVLVEDDPTVGDPTRAYVRVANLLSNSATVNIEVTRTAGVPYSKSYPGLAAKTFTAFDSLAAGGGESYKFSLRNSVTNAEITSMTFTPTVSKKYTVYARGVIGLAASDPKRALLSFYTNF